MYAFVWHSFWCFNVLTHLAGKRMFSGIESKKKERIFFVVVLFLAHMICFNEHLLQLNKLTIHKVITYPIIFSTDSMSFLVGLCVSMLLSIYKQWQNGHKLISIPADNRTI